MKVLLINGPNLNLLGQRDKNFYGTASIEHILGEVQSMSVELGIQIDYYQSNHEGEIIDHIQTYSPQIDGIVINPGALTHYGLSLRDALLDAGLPVVEVHLSNIHGREDYRRNSVITSLSIGQVAGLGWKGYLYALEGLIEYLKS